MIALGPGQSVHQLSFPDFMLAGRLGLEVWQRVMSIEDIGRQMMRLDEGFLAGHKGIFEGAFELADIARPGILHENFSAKCLPLQS